MRLQEAGLSCPDADCWYVRRRAAHAQKTDLPAEASSLGRIVA